MNTAEILIGVVRIRRIIAIFVLILIFSYSCATEPDNTPAPLEPAPEIQYSAAAPQEPFTASSEELPAEPDEVPSSEPAPPENLYIDSIIENMSLSERVSQLFILAVDTVAKTPSTELEEFIKKTRAGGYVLFRDDITTVEDTLAFTDAIKNYYAITPFICIDEEGGTVSRLYSAKLPGYNQKPSAASIGASGDTDNAFATGSEIGKTLASIGVTVDFAPVADVLTNPDNTAIKSRAFGGDPTLVGDMTAAFVDGLHSEGILTAAKHFPGHGNTTGDTHLDSVVINSDIDHLRAVEFYPFIRAIGQKSEFIMTGHITVPEADPSGLPATLSEFFISGILRTELGFTGIIVTDAMNMGAITKNYNPGEAAVMAVSAGVDMILMPEDFLSARDSVIKAVENGDISTERIDESLTRIIGIKINAGIITPPDLLD